MKIQQKFPDLQYLVHSIFYAFYWLNNYNQLSIYSIMILSFIAFWGCTIELSVWIEAQKYLDIFCSKIEIFTHTFTGKWEYLHKLSFVVYI